MKAITGNKLSLLTRLTLWIGGLSLIAVLFFPIWRIELNAPQYPEGLCLKIHANDIKGNVDIINGLNHYIGMKTLHKEDFIEFAVLPYIIAFFAALFVITGFINRKKWFYFSFSLFVLFGIVAMADFWKWEYNYGHNLNPEAAIVVPGMAYQPPLIGFKQLLNFGAYSIPDTGGWIFAGCGGALLVCLILEWRKGLKLRKAAAILFCGILSVTMLDSCSTKPEAIRIGTDNCAYCKMTIADPRFGAEIITATGRAYMFDDIGCMNDFIKGNTIKGKYTIYFVDFCGDHSLVQSGNSILLKSSQLKGPMQGHYISFSSMDSLNMIMGKYGGEKTSSVLP